LECGGVVVNSQTVTDQHAAKVCAEQLGNDTTSTALINYIKGAPWVNENPPPPAWAADPPAGLIAMNYRCLAQFLGDGIILGLDFGSESIQRLGKPSSAQAQVKANGPVTSRHESRALQPKRDGKKRTQEMETFLAFPKTGFEA
jgi:hypothetical protein